MKTLIQFLESKKISKEQFDEKTAEEQAELQKEYGEFVEAETKAMNDKLDKFQALLDESAEKSLSPEEVQNKIDEAVSKMTVEQKEAVTKKDLAELKTAMVEQGKEITDLKAKNDKSAIQKFVDPIMKRVKEGLDKEGAMDALKSIYHDKKGSDTIAFKAPLNTYDPDAAAFFPERVDPEIGTPRQERVRMTDFVNLIPGDDTGSHTYMERYSKTGEAAVVDCGNLKPLVTASFRKITENPFKIAAHTKECDDILLYQPRLLASLNELLNRELRDKRDLTLVDKIQTAASAYNLTTITTTNANEYDAIRASVAQIRSLNGTPTHVFMNPIDAANFEIRKGTDGHYIFLCTCGTNGELSISALRVIETNQIPVGDFLVGDMTRVNMKYITDIMIRIVYGITDVGGGVYTDDNIHDVVTMVAEQFMVMYIKQLDSTCFVYDTFANVITAIS